MYTIVYIYIYIYIYIYSFIYYTYITNYRYIPLEVVSVSIITVYRCIRSWSESSRVYMTFSNTNYLRGTHELALDVLMKKVSLCK